MVYGVALDLFRDLKNGKVREFLPATISWLKKPNIFGLLWKLWSSLPDCL